MGSCEFHFRTDSMGLCYCIVLYDCVVSSIDLIKCPWDRVVQVGIEYIGLCCS